MKAYWHPQCRNAAQRQWVGIKGLRPLFSWPICKPVRMFAPNEKMVQGWIAWNWGGCRATNNELGCTTKIANNDVCRPDMPPCEKVLAT